MGRQIAVAMDLADEADFLQHLRSTADVQLFLCRASSPEQLSVSSFESDLGEFLIHNRAFPWHQRLDWVGSTYCYFYDGDAPVAKYSRHPLRASNPTVAGRLYWSKYFVAQPSALSYDVAAFDRWFSSLVAWIRKHGKRRTHGSAEAWFLPGATRQLANVP